MPFPSPTFTNFIRSAGGYIADEFESLYAQFEGYLRTEHRADGSHGDVTVDTITVRADGAIIFTLTNGTERGRFTISGSQLSVDGAPFYMLDKAVIADQLTITASGTTAGVDAGDITLLGSNARVYESAYGEGMGYYTDYSPTWAASGTQPTNGDFSIARYTRVGDDVSVEMRMNMDGTTTFGTGTYTWTLPVTAETSGNCEGSAVLFDSGTNFRIGSVQLQSTTTFGIVTDAATNIVSATIPFTFAANDYITVRFSYKAA